MSLKTVSTVLGSRHPGFRWTRPCRVGSSFIELRLGQFVDPVGARGSNRAERAEVVDERQEVVATVEPRGRDRAERGEVVATVGEEVVHRDVVGRGRV